jgi:hypothetical protein
VDAKMLEKVPEITESTDLEVEVIFALPGPHPLKTVLRKSPVLYEANNDLANFLKCNSEGRGLIEKMNTKWVAKLHAQAAKNKDGRANYAMPHILSDGYDNEKIQVSTTINTLVKEDRTPTRMRDHNPLLYCSLGRDADQIGETLQIPKMRGFALFMGEFMYWVVENYVASRYASRISSGEAFRELTGIPARKPQIAYLLR